MLRSFPKYFLNGAFWSIAGNVFSKAALFAASFYFAKILGPEQNGYLGAVRNLVIFLSVFAAIGLGTSLTKFISESISRDKNPRYIISWSIKIMLIIIATISFIGISFANSIEQYLIEYSYKGLIIILGMGYFAFYTISQIQIGVLSGFNNFKQMAYLNLGFSIVFLPLAYFCSNNFGLKGVFYAFIISYLINMISYYIIINKRIRIYDLITETKKNRSSFLKFSFAIAGGDTIYVVSAWIIYMLLVKISNYENGGIFAAASIWANTILFIPTSLSKLILSSFGSMNSKSKIIIRNLFHGSIIISTGITFLLVIFSLLLMPIIVKWLGPDYERIRGVFVFLAITTIFQSIGGVCDNFIISQNKALLLQYIQIARQVLTILLTLFILLHIRKDALGLAIAISIGTLLGEAIKFITSEKLLNKLPI